MSVTATTLLLAISFRGRFEENSLIFRVYLHGRNDCVVSREYP